VWPTARGTRTLIGVVLGQRGGDLVAAGLDAAAGLAARFAPHAGLAHTSGAPPGPPPAAAYRGHMENRIRAGNSSLP
jgi:hypothetical protein